MLTLHSPESIAAYIRVSTYDQKTESQREEIARWLKNHGIAPESIQWFEDKETGKTLHLSYKDEDGNWQRTNSYDAGDLFIVKLLAEKAAQFLADLQLEA